MLLALFGYMDLMIISKWRTNYFGHEDLSPSIITTMVGLFLEGGKVQGMQMWRGQQYTNQLMTCKFSTHITIVVLACACVPWMLLVKPFLEFKENEAKVKERKLRGDVELREYQVFHDVCSNEFICFCVGIGKGCVCDRWGTRPGA